MPTSAFRLAVTTADPAASARRAREALPGGGGVLYYALGGGLGHLTRALAIRRHFARRAATPFVVLANCRAALPEPGVVLDLSGEEPTAAGLAALVAVLAAELRPAVLAVDAFPAGVLGELPPVLAALPCRKAALLRRLQPPWVERWRLEEVLPAYDAVFALEPGAPAGDPVPPPLLRDPEDLLPRAAARAALTETTRDHTRPLLLAVATATDAPALGLLGLTHRLGEALGAEVRVATPFPGAPPGALRAGHWPLLEALRGVDLLVGAPGFNLWHEARATGTPAVWVPQPRRYDDQAARAAGGVVARSPADLEARLAEALAAPAAPRPATFPNGAADLAARLLALCDA